MVVAAAAQPSRCGPHPRPSNSELRIPPFTRMANDFVAASLNLSIAGIQSKQCLRVLETMMALEWKGNLSFLLNIMRVVQNTQCHAILK